MQQLFVWRVDSQGFALPFPNVARVVRAAALMPAQQSSPFICGLLDVQGKLLPVVDVRKRFHLPERSISPADHFIIVHTAKRMLALWADTVDGLMDCQDAEPAQDGMTRLAEGILLLHDLEQCLEAAH